MGGFSSIVGLSQAIANTLYEAINSVSTHAALSYHMPSGAILMWHGLIVNIPTGYVLCNGANSTPDLRSKFLRGAPNATEAGGTGGADTHTLTTAEMPAHAHSIEGDTSTGTIDVIRRGNYAAGAISTTSTGDGGAHNNMPAYYQILFIMKT